MNKVNPNFIDEIKKYGANDFSACYNCGSCTAVCNLTDKNANFPRMFIRYGMLGQTDEIKSSKEIWLCYACGDCSETCPRQAHPGEYMAALRRFSIAAFDKTGITKLLFKSNPLYIVFTMIIATILGFLVLSIKPETPVARWLFDVVPFQIIHDLGTYIFIIAGLSAVTGIFFMFRNLNKQQPKTKKDTKTKIFQAWYKVFMELITMKRYQSCDTEEYSYWKSKHWLFKPWFVHWSIMWGFIGLLIATTLNFILKDPATNIWLPTRILGTATGILMMWGSTLAIIYRITKPTDTYADSKLADWVLLIIIWLAGLTGFWLELAVTINKEMAVHHVIFFIHTVISMELVLLFAFSKFAHVVYRPLALYYYYKNEN